LNRKSNAKVLNTVFSWGIYFCLLAGGLAFFGFLIGIIMGGESAQALAVWIHKEYFPVIIRVASITVGFGLLSMYFSGEQALSLVSDKKEAEAELNAVKDQQTKH